MPRFRTSTSSPAPAALPHDMTLPRQSSPSSTQGTRAPSRGRRRDTPSRSRHQPHAMSGNHDPASHSTLPSLFHKPRLRVPPCFGRRCWPFSGWRGRVRVATGVVGVEVGRCLRARDDGVGAGARAQKGKADPAEACAGCSERQIDCKELRRLQSVCAPAALCARVLAQSAEHCGCAPVPGSLPLFAAASGICYHHATHFPQGFEFCKDVGETCCAVSG